jgi:hypothetical protein
MLLIVDKGKKEAEKEDDEKLKHTLEDSFVGMDVEEQFSIYRRNLLTRTGTWLQKEPLSNTRVDKKAPILWVWAALDLESPTFRLGLF